jgi:hypothetical protein
MNLVKSPHEMLLEEAGAIPSSPGLVNTPSQMLARQFGLVPHLAQGGDVSTADMLAEMAAHHKEPSKFKKLIKQIPMPQTASLALNATLGLPGAVEAHHSLQENLQGGNYGSAAQNAYELGSAFSPYFLVPGIYDAGRYFSESAAGHLSHNPVYRQQMQDMSSTPIGGALAGDTGLASQIMGQHEYDEAPSILANTRLSK